MRFYAVGSAKDAGRRARVTSFNESEPSLCRPACASSLDLKGIPSYLIESGGLLLQNLENPRDSRTRPLRASRAGQLSVDFIRRKTQAPKAAVGHDNIAGGDIVYMMLKHLIAFIVDTGRNPI